MALTLTPCRGMLDVSRTDMYSVHHWLMEAVSFEPSRDVVVVNASFTTRHSQRYPCYEALVAHATRRPNASFLAVSFHISTFIPRYASPGSPPNVRWLVMEPTYPNVAQLVVPYVMLKPTLPSTQTPWTARRLVLFAGHMPKLYLSRTRARIAHVLKASPEATTALGPLRMSSEEYARALFDHRFCIVAPGDTLSTKKLAETIVVGSYGGCVPLVHRSTTLPYADRFDYAAAVVFFDESSLLSTLDRLRHSDAGAFAAWRRALRRMRHAFEQPHAGRYALRVASSLSSAKLAAARV